MGVILLSLLNLTLFAQENWEASRNPTVDSIAAKYKDKLVQAPVPGSVDKIFPVIGQYEPGVGSDEARVTITLDENNKGVIWVDGLPQGRFRALLAKSPATYKIPAQKNQEGKDLQEGTLLYDPLMNTLSICIGKPFNATDPTAAFMPPAEPEITGSSAKTKTARKVAAPKPWVYTGTKIVNATAGN